MREYVKIYCCGDCIQYNWKKHKCNLGAQDEGDAREHFYKDCPLGIHEEEEDEHEEIIHQYHERHKEVLKEMSMPVGRNVMDALRERRTDGTNDE